MTCTFFGHRFVYENIEPDLRSALIDLIENQNVNLFYVGNHGGFDAMVCRVLKSLSEKYSITYRVVLAYLPTAKKRSTPADDPNTILPDGIETVPKRFAISYCNHWMIRRADYAITYVPHTVGSGTAKFKSLAQKRGKTVIELYKPNDFVSPKK